jgi:hypothetical protein
MSAMKLELNGKASSGKKTKHLDINSFILRIYLKDKKCKLSTVQLKKWLQTTWPSPLLNPNSSSSETTSWMLANILGWSAGVCWRKLEKIKKENSKKIKKNIHGIYVWVKWVKNYSWWNKGDKKLQLLK